MHNRQGTHARCPSLELFSTSQIGRACVQYLVPIDTMHRAFSDVLEHMPLSYLRPSYTFYLNLGGRRFWPLAAAYTDLGEKNHVTAPKAIERKGGRNMARTDRQNRPAAFYLKLWSATRLITIPMIGSVSPALRSSSRLLPEPPKKLPELLTKQLRAAFSLPEHANSLERSPLFRRRPARSSFFLARRCPSPAGSA